MICSTGATLDPLLAQEQQDNRMGQDHEQDRTPASRTP